MQAVLRHQGKDGLNRIFCSDDAGRAVAQIRCAAVTYKVLLNPDPVGRGYTEV
jgi:hypothetical protein